MARWPPLRSLRYLLPGLPGLRARERELVREGNELTRRSIILLRVAAACGLLVSLENPQSSRIWHHPELVRSLDEWGFAKITTHYCQWGELYKKPTSIAANYTSIECLMRRCSGDHMHAVLRGRDSSGASKTSLAAAYPRSLCSAWAQCIDDVARSRFVHNRQTHKHHSSHSKHCPRSPCVSVLCSIPEHSLLVDPLHENEGDYHRGGGSRF